MEKFMYIIWQSTIDFCIVNNKLEKIGFSFEIVPNSSLT